MTVINTSKRAFVKMAPELLTDFFKEGMNFDGVRIKKGLPKDAVFIGVWHDPTTFILNLVFASETFAEVKEGDVPPEVTV